MSKRREYTTIALPKPLVNEIDQLIENGKWGFTSRTEVVKEALRRYLINYQKKE